MENKPVITSGEKEGENEQDRGRWLRVTATMDKVSKLHGLTVEHGEYSQYFTIVVNEVCCGSVVVFDSLRPHGL